MLLSSRGLRGSMLSRAMSTTRETRRFARDTRRLGKIEQELDFQVGREVSGRTIPKPTRVILDATDKPVGRLATEISGLLQGKHKPTFVPHVENGDYVTVTNGHLVRFTGRKWKQKLYHWHSMYPGGLKKRNAHDMLLRNGPEEIIRRAVSGMLPKNNLRARRMKRLMIVQGGEGTPPRELRAIERVDRKRD